MVVQGTKMMLRIGQRMLLLKAALQRAGWANHQIGAAMRGPRKIKIV
jgi:hypothetical protein